MNKMNGSYTLFDGITITIDEMRYSADVGVCSSSTATLVS